MELQWLLAFQIYHWIYCHIHLEKQHNQFFPSSINKFMGHWHIIVFLAHANQSLSTQKAGLPEMNYSVSEGSKAKKKKKSETIY